ncbi:protein of unknown function DUF2493 [Hokovirus HKV1]|uniref:YspA cpYpsA-related SLOG domain-containing protein n=1 Tax=Hokovirus HKV1 TaxID=1977638 RepID=A0A1V0SF92_9VIRU|nr:protein of unknown function DUF2493 [Hokovirus HKV1]
MLKIAIVGSRTFNDYELFKKYLTEYIDNIQEYSIVSGGAIGTDTMAKKFAIENNKEILEILPDWKKHGKIAGILRNTDIIKAADIVIAFIKDNSAGTRDSIEKAKKMNKTLKVYNL